MNIREPYKVLNDWVCTCSGCPTQYQGHLTTGEFVYFRYRWGHVSFEISVSEHEWYGNLFAYMHEEKIGNAMDGVLGDWEVQALIEPWIAEYYAGREK